MDIKEYYNAARSKGVPANRAICRAKWFLSAWNKTKEEKNKIKELTTPQTSVNPPPCIPH